MNSSSILNSQFSTRHRIGVFDSGLGGLTVVRDIRRRFPGLDIVYVADTAHAPYGLKRPEEIRHYSDAITRYLIDHHTIDALVVACNTATSAAIEHLRTSYPERIIVGTEPGIKPALSHTQSNKVGILATPATLAGDKYQELADRLYNGTDIALFEQACPGLVEQIEAGEIDSDKTTAMLEGWLAPMREAGVDTIVLGCTHYPLVGKTIQKVMASDVTLVETGDAIAQRLGDLLSIPDSSDLGELVVLSTGWLDHGAVRRILGDTPFVFGSME